MTKRKSGILVHITSLPGKEGTGTLGKNAFQFVDFLEKAKQKLWQILPLGQVGYGDSPYQCYSAYAGNIQLIDLELLVGDFEYEFYVGNNPFISNGCLIGSSATLTIESAGIVSEGGVSIEKADLGSIKALFR